jgi:hypothetical protein
MLSDAMTLTDSLHYFTDLFLWSVNLLALRPFLLLAVVCLVNTILAFLVQRPFRSGVWRSSYWLIFTQFLFFPALLAVGAGFPAVTGSARLQENQLGRYLLDALFLLSLLTGALWLYRMKGLRWLSASLLVLQQVFVIGAGFIAGMSVSGDWL